MAEHCDHRPVDGQTETAEFKPEEMRDQQNDVSFFAQRLFVVLVPAETHQTLESRLRPPPRDADIEQRLAEAAEVAARQPRALPRAHVGKTKLKIDPHDMPPLGMQGIEQ